MTEGQRDRRLPPPAFPPGSRRHPHTNSDERSEERSGSHDSGRDGFISPDESLPPRQGSVDHAFILPDEPLPGRDTDPGPEEGVVTGMGDDAHLDPAELVSLGDPHVREITGAVERLAAALKHKGEAGLRTEPYMGRFEATLRAYCTGYLAGRRAEDEADAGEFPPYTGFDSDG